MRILDCIASVEAFVRSIAVTSRLPGMIKSHSDFLPMPLVLTAALCLAGCAGSTKYAGTLQLEERWERYDRALIALEVASPNYIEKFVRLESPAQDRFITAACANDVDAEGEICRSQVGQLLTEYYSDVNGDTLRMLPVRLVGLSYQAAICTWGDSGLLPSHISLALQLVKKLDTEKIRRSREMLTETKRSLRAIDSLVHNSRSLEDEQLVLRTEANTAADNLNTSQWLLADLEGYARQCGKKRIRETIAAELNSVIGFISAQDPTSAVSYTLLEASREVPPGFKAEFASLSNEHIQTSLRSTARYALGKKILSWQTGRTELDRPFALEVAELIDFLYSDASNSDRIANLLHRAHWAHVFQVSAADPIAVSLATGGKDLSTDILTKTRIRNACAATSLLVLSKAVQLADEIGAGKMPELEIETLVKRAESIRETLSDCDPPANYVSCAATSAGSREYFRKATSSLADALTGEVKNFEVAISSLSPSDIQTRRNVMTAQLIASLRLLLRSIDSKSSCYL